MTAWRFRLLGTAGFALIALGLSAAQLLPSVEFTRLSVRADSSYAFVSGGFPLRDTWQLLLPGVLTQFSPLYVGVIGLGLAVCALGLLGRNGMNRVLSSEYQVSSVKCQVSSVKFPVSGTQTRYSLLNTQYALLFFLALTLIALLLSYGGNGFLYPLFYWVAPGWKLFRGQERAAYLVTLGLSGLAGYGLAALPVLPLARRRLLAALFGVTVTAGVYAFGLLWQLNGRTAIGPWSYLGIAFITLVLAMIFAVLLWWDGWSQRRALALIGLALLNLFWANFTTNLAPFGPARKMILAPEMEALQAAVAQRNDVSAGLPGRVYNEFRIYEDYGMRQEIEDVWGSSPLRLARYAALFDQFPLDRAWRLTGVEHVLSWRREIFEPSELLAEFPQVEDTTYLHRLQADNPRAWIVPRTQRATDAEALALLANHGFDLDSTALLPPEARADMVRADGAQASAGNNRVTLARLSPRALHIAVESERGGLLLLSENWVPGWRVRNAVCEVQRAESGERQPSTADCPALPVLRADLTFIGIPVPAGRTAFDLIYWPDSVRYGLWISGVTLVLVAMIVGMLWWRRRAA